MCRVCCCYFGKAVELEKNGVFNSASKLAGWGKDFVSWWKVVFEAIPFECIGRDSIGFGMAAKSRRSL